MIDLKKVSACLITKEAYYPRELIGSITAHPFGEIMFLMNCDSPYRKYELFAKAKYDLIYYSDDDALCPILQLSQLADPDKINVAMKEGHYQAHKDNRATMGMGWGTIFPKSVLQSLKLYTDIYGQDEVFKRETERILTYLNYPQNRLILPIHDLPSAWGEDRLWRQPNHNQSKLIAEQRCKQILHL